MKNYIISEQLAQTVINFLGQQPYATVFQMITALQQMQEASIVETAQVLEAAPTETVVAPAETVAAPTEEPSSTTGEEAKATAN